MTLGSNDVEELMERQFSQEQKLDGGQATGGYNELEPAIKEPVTEASGAKDPFGALMTSENSLYMS